MQNTQKPQDLEHIAPIIIRCLNKILENIEGNDEKPLENSLN